MPEASRRAALCVCVFAISAATLLFAGCGTRVGRLYERVMGSPTYAQTTEKYTRTKEVHDGLDTRFILSATWLSPDWVRAFTEEFTSIYYLDTERTEKVTRQWKDESERHARFFVALFVPDERGNDLEKEGTLWSLRLVRADEKDFAPAYVRKSDLKPAEISRFFPYSGTWYRAYEVAFPKEAMGGEPAKPGTPRLKLVLSGVQGRAVLAWE
ncbi:MAG: hypothetical protein HY896_00290 [Deltaproteobacteria bacterium]|nr:hypothetical protein [Deltaproteobacteria bacterium]